MRKHPTVIEDPQNFGSVTRRDETRINAADSSSIAARAQPPSTATLKGAPGLVSPAGLTVYVFDFRSHHARGQSACNGDCAANWLPVRPSSGTLPAPFSRIARQDGSVQLMSATRPLYRFIGDSEPGQTNGDGLNVFGGVWRIARPQPQSAMPRPWVVDGGGYWRAAGYVRG